MDPLYVAFVAFDEELPPGAPQRSPALTVLVFRLACGERASGAPASGQAHPPLALEHVPAEWT
jgi:hypothetical protein